MLRSRSLAFSRLLATALTASALLAPAAAQADWNVESFPPADYSAVDLALAGNGDLALRTAWRIPITGETRGSVDRVEDLRVRSPGGAFTTSDGAGRDELLADRHGGLATLGYDEGRIVGSSRAAGGAFGPLAPVTPEDGSLSAHASSTGGAVAFTYTSGTKVRIVVRPAGGGYGAPVDLAPQTANSLSLGVADDGSAIATWERYVDNMPATEYRVRSAAGTWGPTTTVTGRWSRVAMGPDGDAMLVVSGNTHVQAMTMRAGQAFGPLTDVAPLGTSSSWSLPAMGPDGIGAVFVHQVRDGVATFGARRFDGTAFGTLQDLRSGTSDGAIALVVDDERRIWFASTASTDGGGTARILVRRADGATFGPAEQVIAPATNVSTMNVDFATDGHGRAALAWSDGIGDAERLHLATSGLPATRTDAPAGEQQGRPVPSALPAAGATPAPAPQATQRASAPVKLAPATTLARLAVTVRRGRATVAFRASAAAKVTVVVERRVGKRWLRAKRVTVTAKAGTNRAAVGAVSRGRYRVTATAGKATTKATFRVR